MAFNPAGRGWTTIKLPTKANITYTAGMFLYSDGADNVPVVDASQSNIIGIALEDKANDSSTTSIHVRIPTSEASTFEADMESGETLSKANEGDLFDFADGALTISTASTYDTVQLIKYISSSKGVFRLNTTRGIEN